MSGAGSATSREHATLRRDEPDAPVSRHDPDEPSGFATIGPSSKGRASVTSSRSRREASDAEEARARARPHAVVRSRVERDAAGRLRPPRLRRGRGTGSDGSRADRRGTGRGTRSRRRRRPAPSRARARDVPQARGRAEPTDRQPVDAVEPVAARSRSRGCRRGRVATSERGGRSAARGAATGATRIRPPAARGARRRRPSPPTRVAARGLDRGHRSLEGRPDVAVARTGRRRVGRPPRPGRATGPLPLGEPERQPAQAGSRPLPAARRSPSRAARPRHDPHVPVLVQRQVAARRRRYPSGRARVATRACRPSARPSRPPTCRTRDRSRRARARACRPTSGGGTSRALLPPATRPRWPCWVRNRNESDPVAASDTMRFAGQPRVGGHVEDVEAEAVEAGEPPEGRQPELTARQTGRCR